MGFSEAYESDYLVTERLRPAETARWDGGMFHVTAHAVDDLYAFGDAQDRNEFLDRFRRHLSPQPVRDPLRRELFPHHRDIASLVAFCVLENHYHLILRQFTSPGVQRLMRSVLVSYGRYFNNKYDRRVGAQIWSSEYTATPIKSKLQGASAVAYVTLNHEVRRERYLHCSHDYYVGDRRAEWLDVKSGLWFFGGDASEYERALRDEGLEALERKIRRRAVRAERTVRGRPGPRRGPGTHFVISE